jgi:hypothetical protein
MMLASMFRQLGYIVALAAVLCTSANAAISADEVKSLPGWEGKLPTNHYSG